MQCVVKSCLNFYNSLVAKIKIYNILCFTEECIARENVIKSSYENRITKVEKEKTELQAERDRLLREVEIVSQRVNTLQRQLHTQQVGIILNLLTLQLLNVNKKNEVIIFKILSRE